MNLVLVYNGFPGYYGIDEEEIRTTLSFWYLLQESLWEATYPNEEKQGQQMGTAKELYREVVNTLRRKVTWLANPIAWDAGALNDPIDDLWLSVLVRAEQNSTCKSISGCETARVGLTNHLRYRRDLATR